MGLKWKRNAQFARKPIRPSIIRKSIAVTVVLNKQIRKNKVISINSVYDFSWVRLSLNLVE